jgi:DNA-binding FadR family transcriptional regulator
MSARTRFDDYRKMADAILAGDAATAERVSRTHIARTAKIVRSRLA